MGQLCGHSGSTQCNFQGIFISSFSDPLEELSKTARLVWNLKQAANQLPVVHSLLEWLMKHLYTVKDLSFCLLWHLVFGELFGFIRVAKKGKKHSEQWIVWLSFLLFITPPSVSLLHTHTDTHKDTHTRTHRETCRRCRVTIFSHAGVSLPHDNCEFNWCCHMVCNGVSSDCRGSVKETQIFLQEKRRLSRAGIKKKTPLSD